MEAGGTPREFTTISVSDGIPTELSILCGLAIGYPDPEFPAINCTSAGSPSRRTWFSSTTNPGETKGHPSRLRSVPIRD
jgi:hypothetical protein